MTAMRTPFRCDRSIMWGRWDVAAVEEFLSEWAEGHVGLFAVGQHGVDARPTSLNGGDAMPGVMAVKERKRAGEVSSVSTAP